MRISVPWRLTIGIMLLLALFFLGSYFYPQIQVVAQPISVSDSGAGGPDNLYFQLVKPDDGLLERLGVDESEWQRSNAVPFVMTVNAHSGDIRSWDLGQRIYVRDENGTRYSVVARQTLSSQHHTTWVCLVPSFNDAGEALVERDSGYLDFVVVSSSPGGASRVLTLELPLEDSKPSPLMAYLLIPLAVAGVLMYSVSPCAMGSFAIASVIVTASTSVRQRWVNMASFGGGYVLALLLAGITFLVVGSRLEAEPFWLRRLELVGGVVMAVIGLWLLASSGWGPLSAVVNRLHDSAGRRLNSGEGMSWGTSFALGVGLSLGCASCVGIVGLSLLIPLLTMMGVASMGVVMAAFGIMAFGYFIPFILMVTGLPQGLTLQRRVALERWLRVASGGFMLAIAAVFLAGASHLMTNLEWEIMGWGELVVRRALGLLGL